VTAGIALLAGASAVTALRLGASMLCLQASIGAVNDLADARLDRVGKPAKPIPAGTVSLSIARMWAFLTGSLGLLLAEPSGTPALAVAALGLGLGYLYDLRLSRTALSWLPLALALPLVPIFAWLGAGGTLPATLLAVVPIAALAGSALMTANGLVDVERDAIAGKPTVAVAIGRARAWVVHAIVFAIALALAFAVAPGGLASALLGPSAPGSGASGSLRIVGRAGMLLGTLVIAVGAWLLLAYRPAIRERGWELEAIGTGLIGIGWLAGVAGVMRGGAGP
jgi:4-hydroxybenzoate polyprenyltransferase